MLKRCEVCGLADDVVTPDNATAGEMVNEVTEGGKVPTAEVTTSGKVPADEVTARGRVPTHETTAGSSAKSAARAQRLVRATEARTGGGTAICAAMLAQFIRFLTGSNLHRNGFGSELNCVSKICTTTGRVVD